MAGSFAGCYGATQVELVIATNANCDLHTETQIRVGKSANAETAASTTICGATEPQLGTLTLVPSGDRDDTVFVTVVSAFGIRPEECNAPENAKKCITAKRRVSYIAHQSLRIPIVMSEQCRGLPCDDEQTCAVGQCIPVELCGESRCPGETPEVLADAGLVDAADATDASVDAERDARTLVCNVLAANENINGSIVVTPTRIAWPSADLGSPGIHYVNRTAPGDVARIPLPGLFAPTAIAFTGAPGTPPAQIAWGIPDKIIVTDDTGSSQVSSTPRTGDIATGLFFSPTHVLGVLNRTGMPPGAMWSLDRATSASLEVSLSVTTPPGASTALGDALFLATPASVVRLDQAAASTLDGFQYSGIVRSLTRNSTRVFFVHDGTLSAVASTGTDVVIGTNIDARLIAATDSAVYFLTPPPTKLRRFDLKTKQTRLVGLVSKTHGNPDKTTNFVADELSPSLTRVYFVQEDTRILSCDVP